MAEEAPEAIPQIRGHGAWSRRNKEELMNRLRDALAHWGKNHLRLPAVNRDNDKELAFILYSFQADQAIYIKRVWEPAEATEAVDGNAFHLKIQRSPAAVVKAAGCCESRPEAEEFDPDGFPGATVLYPVGREQWLSQLAVWMLKAGLRVSSIITVTLIDVQLCKDMSGTGTVPNWLAYTFVAASVVALITEIFFAWRRTRDAARPVIYQNGNMIFASELLLRFLGLPHTVLNATTFDVLDRLGGVPIACNISRTAWKYENCSGNFQVLPKLLAEDLVMAALKASLSVYQTTTALSVALLTAVISTFLGAKTLRDYFKILLDYDDEMLDHMRNFGDPFDLGGRRRNAPFEGIREFLRIDPDRPNDGHEGKRTFLRKIIGCRQVRREEASELRGA